MSEGKLKLAILAGQDLPATCMAISVLAALPVVEICGILTESQAVPMMKRLRSLRRRLRREGWSYLYFRILEAFQGALEQKAAGLSPRREVRELLSRAFPQNAFCLADFGSLKKISIQEFRNLNDLEAVETLRSLDVDLGVVLGTRVLKRSTFSVPRLGCVNLHKGKVPEYRGLPPGFWEIYDGQSSAGVTVHFVDDGLDTGDVLGEDCVSIHPKDTPVTLRRKLDLLGNTLLARCITELAEGRAVRRPQPPSTRKARTAPTRMQRRDLEERRGIATSVEASWGHSAKTLLYLLIYHSGLYHLARAWRKVRQTSRSCILLYHRVNDQAEDALTTGIERFAEHLVVLRKHYSVVPTSELVAAVKSTRKVPGNSVAIHFDDCYRDVYTKAAPLLRQAGMPACSFISSGFVDTDRVFEHDAEKCPFRFENLSSNEIRELVEGGAEVGAHTASHVDLGQCSLAIAAAELQQSKRDLEAILSRPVTLFSYPFGREHNIRREVVPLVQQAGYEAMFSAHGGCVSEKSDLYDLPRVGISGQFRPLDLLMEIEGFSLGALKLRWAKRKKIPIGDERLTWPLSAEGRQ